MSDYSADVGILRGQFSDMLAENDEQFTFVITNALTNVDFDDAIELGQLGDEANQELVVSRLRKMADAIEAGEIS